jgi:hypothetical protein
LKLGPSFKEPKESTSEDGDKETPSPNKKPRVDDKPFLVNIVTVIRVSCGDVMTSSLHILFLTVSFCCNRLDLPQRTRVTCIRTFW